MELKRQPSKPVQVTIRDSSHTLPPTLEMADAGAKRETFHDLMKARFPQATHNAARDRYEFSVKQDVAVGATMGRVFDAQAESEKAKAPLYQSQQREGDKRLVIVDSLAEALAHAELNKKGLSETRYVVADVNDPNHRQTLAREISTVKDNQGRVVVAVTDERKAEAITALVREQNAPSIMLKPKESLEQTLQHSRQRKGLELSM